MLSPRAIRGVNLGWSSDSSCWNIGCFPDKNLEKFTVYQVSNAVFIEDVMVRDLRALMRDDTESLDSQILERLPSSVVEGESTGTVGNSLNKRFAGVTSQNLSQGKTVEGQPTFDFEEKESISKCEVYDLSCKDNKVETALDSGEEESGPPVGTAATDSSTESKKDQESE